MTLKDDAVAFCRVMALAPFEEFHKISLRADALARNKLQLVLNVGLSIRRHFVLKVVSANRMNDRRVEGHLGDSFYPAIPGCAAYIQESVVRKPS
jgi:hypothetical protein